MESEATELANIILKLNDAIYRYKAKNFDVNFKINSTGNVDLSLRQYLILHLIHSLNVKTLTQISGATGISNSSLSIVISKMTANGYIIKNYARKNQDGRKIYFELTKKGIDALDEQNALTVSMLFSFFDKLSTEKYTLFVNALKNFAVLLDVDYPDEPDRKKFAVCIFNCCLKAGQWLSVHYENIVQKCTDGIGCKAKITPNMYELLWTINYTKINNFQELAQFKGISESTLSTSVSKLAEFEYLTKVRANMEHDTDSRKLFFYLTPDGEKLVDKIHASICAVVRDFYITLSEEDLKRLYDGVNNMYTIFTEI